MVTQTHTPFETLARVIEHFEADGRSVRRTEAADDGEGSLRATLDVSVPASAESAGLAPVTASIDGGLSVTFRATGFPDSAPPLPSGCPPVSVVSADARIDGGTVVVTVAVTVGAADGTRDGDDITGGPEGAAGVTAAFGAGRTDAGSERDVDRTARGSTQGDRGAGTTSGTERTEPDAEEPDPSLSAVRDESVPPYDDTPYLRRLYETSETFAEMSHRIEMDVSGETVRRYMTEAGIHSPDSYETADGNRDSTGSDAAPESDPDDARSAAAGSPTSGAPVESREETASDTDGDPAPLPDEQLVADGIGLPEALTLREVVDAVVTARTVHEVHREIGLSHDRTRRLLTQLNLLDLVVGRVGAASDDPVTVEAVADRIRQRAPDGV